MKFNAVIELHGNNQQPGIVVPEEVIKGLGGGWKPAVSVTIGHYSYRSTDCRNGWTISAPNQCTAQKRSRCYRRR